MKILMLASENDALPGGKVGGVADVIRDIVPALATLGHSIRVVTPSYGLFHKAANSLLLFEQQLVFGGRIETLRWYRVPAKEPAQGVELLVVDHPLFAVAGKGVIYCDDPPDNPFAHDASRFSLLCAACGQALVQGLLEQPELLHLHDWHAAALALLRRYHPAYASLKSLPAVFTVHNLALQGIRPWQGDLSSLFAWFPELRGQDFTEIADPRFPQCLNLMRAGINLCERVHLVSPTYATEVVKPSNHSIGFFGGEGLEQDMLNAQSRGRLAGILNGCVYPPEPSPRLEHRQLLAILSRELSKQIRRKHTGGEPARLALRLLDRWKRRVDFPGFLLTFVGRLTTQKVLILCHPMPDGRIALEQLLDDLGDRDIFILLGSGDRKIESMFEEIMLRNRNFLFLRGYSETISDALYRAGDLFLMPSSFEPCGISQMLAMRSGQPCLVHAVGGLCDTVSDGKNGFHFGGKSLESQVEAMLVRLKQARELLGDVQSAQRFREATSAARFSWAEASARYVEKLYRPLLDEATDNFRETFRSDSSGWSRRP